MQVDRRTVLGASLAAGTAASAGSVTHSFPKLRVVLGHMGEALPFWMWRLDHMAARRQRGGRMKPLQMQPSAYFLRNFAVTTSGFEDADVLDLVIRRVGIGNVLWAIDYPYEESADAVRFIDAAPLNATQRTAILHRNAERVFHIPAT
jgi:5-carboxyvanillate decarboxylase